MQRIEGQTFAWRVYVARRRKVRQQKFYLAAGIILLTVAALAWYLGFYIQRPVYALGQAAKALETHDMELFARRVDVASVCSFGYDDLTYMLFAHDANLKEEERSRAGKFYENVKPAVTEGLQRSLESGVRDGTFALPTGVDMLKGRQLGIDYEYLLDYSCLRTTTLLSVQNAVRDGSGAMAVIAVREEETGLEFPLQLRMEKGPEGWHIVRIMNYRAYLDAVQTAQGADLMRYIEATRPIVDRYNGVFRSMQRDFGAWTKTSRASYTTRYSTALIQLLQEDMIPLLKKYQGELDAVDVPAGARRLAAQRKEATEAFIRAYESYVQGLLSGAPEPFAAAETAHKEALAADMRAGDMIRRAAVSEETPATP